MGYEIGTKRGVANHYGPRGADNQYGGQDNSSGVTKSASWTFDYNKLPVATLSNLEMQIPANATIVNVHLTVKEAFASAGAAALSIGTTATDGTGAAATSLAAPAQLTNALVTVKGNRIAGAGALVGKTVGAKAVEVTVVSSHTLTAGKGEIVVHYQYN
tara:strand:+ start:149 stop:625 length:477 start_codon:yes stop_codon:yes gene_type:complete